MSRNQEVIKIFVGDGENDELSRMAREREKQGYTVGTHANDSNVKQAWSQAGGKIVIAEGSKLGMCVRHVIQRSLENGAKQVIVDLNNCRVDERDEEDWFPFSLSERAHSLSILAETRIYKENKHKVKVIPENIWDEELRKL